MGEEGSGSNGGVKRRKRYEAPVIWLWFAGRDLDEEGSKGRTNATWLEDATRVFHPTGHAGRWSRMRHWKRSAIRQSAVLGAVLIGWDWWFHPFVTILGLSELAALYGGYYGWRGGRKFFPVKHYWQYVRPFSHTLRAELGIVPTYLQVTADRSSVVLGLPHEYLGSDHERAAITKAVQEKLGMIEPDPSWNLKGRNHEAKFTQSEPPPLEVLPRHVIPAIRAAKEHELIHGCVRGGDILKRSVDQDSPHICHSIESGGGKSTATMNLGCQHLFHGGILIILDTKMVSHMWADGLPNVVYAYTPAMVHQALIWLANDDEQESELTYRKRIGRKHANLDGEIETDIGPRIFVIAEELPATQRALKRYWKSIGQKGAPPSAAALDDLSDTGRQFGIHVDYIAQRASAKAISGSGSADSSENIGTWVWSNPTDRTWKLLGEGHAKPPPTDHKGRYHMMDASGLTCFQGVKWTPREARDFATSGTRAEPHRDLPFIRHVGPVVVPQSIAQGPAEQPVVVRQVPSRAPGVTIREALDSGMFGAVGLEALRQRVARKQLVHVGWDGASKLYDRDDLKELIR